MFSHRGITILLCVVLNCLLLEAGASDATQASFQTASAYCTKRQCKYQLGKLDWEKASAVASFNDSLLVTGWGILDVSSGFSNDSSQSNDDIMFAAGFIEGVLTAKHIEYQNVNLRSIFLNQPKPGVVKKLNEWFVNQRKWADSMIAIHKGSSPMWRHVSYILSQLDGLYAGYKSVRKNQKGSLDYFAFNFLQASGDLFDLMNIVDSSSVVDWRKLTRSEARRYIHSIGHCSALIKILPGYENMFMSHSTWFEYQSMDRIYKHYNFNVNDPNTAAKKISFASYGGFLESLDDFYLLGSGMVMLQTTNNIFDSSLYSHVTVNSLFAWQRVRVASMMAHSGREWTDIIARYNSGTYNNQYMIIDLKKVELRKHLPDGTLWVAEQIPGLVVAEDLTRILRAGYFSSYNVPFFEEIYNKSGYPEFVAQMGPDFSYELAPRAKIFRRDEGNVKDMESMKKLMRSNDYRNDPYSEGNAMNTICSRGDLDSPFPGTLGCYDTKVSDFQMAKAMQADIISGPTLGNDLPPFAWKGSFENVTHVGLPQVYNFSFIGTQPTLSWT